MPFKKLPGNNCKTLATTKLNLLDFKHYEDLVVFSFHKIFGINREKIFQT